MIIKFLCLLQENMLFTIILFEALTQILKHDIDTIIQKFFPVLSRFQTYKTSFRPQLVLSVPKNP